jgi:uncharacterized protein YdiU (UPF0061 family)
MDSKAEMNELKDLLEGFPAACDEAVCRMWKRKLGLVGDWEEGVGELFRTLEAMMATGAVDYTVFWRRLADVPTCAGDDEAALELLQEAFYDNLTASGRSAWLGWLRDYRARVRQEGRPAEEVARAMKLTSPKYIPREWMLRDAYQAAYKVCRGLRPIRQPAP